MSESEGNRRRRPPRRREDRTATYTQGLWPQLGRDFVLVVVATLVLIAVTNIDSTNTKIQATNLKIQDGRRVGTAFTCSALGAVAQAGRNAIEQGSSAKETKLSRFLERFGYPTSAQRRTEAVAAGTAYTATINNAVVKSVGPRARGLVQKDGTFDCKKLAQLSVVKPLTH